MGKDQLPILLMVLVQLGYAGTAIISKLVMNEGMDPYVHLSYRQIFATISIAPFAYFFERKTRPKLTPFTIFLIFLCSIFGVTAMQLTLLIGLKNSTATIATAMSNLVPANTFLLAVLCGVVGSIVAIIGLYSVLWGKKKEMKGNTVHVEEEMKEDVCKEDNKLTKIDDLEVSDLI
ncbi:PREDICTED: WAT1-related protein At1g09380-like [Nicotiana attenuata]|uniref:WAT1-related protein At1g09380-like n=1 Tax=Nicotiana attenuata TaxID=49451 RepID=UPI0009051556|nr:PREDICTED: WAT1-related protein At1g09380-like [Nicotiana attenuata]